MIDFTKEGRVGDRVKSRDGDDGVIVEIKPYETYTIFVDYIDGQRCYTKDGRFLADDSQPSLMFANGSVTIDQGSPPDREAEVRHCGLTRAQWRRIIDEEFLVGVSNESFKHAREGTRKATLIDHLKIGDINSPPFIEKHNSKWEYAAIPDMKGIRKPHFGGVCATDHEGEITFKLRNGDWVNMLISKGVDVWHWHEGERSSSDVMEYVELP